MGQVAGGNPTLGRLCPAADGLIERARRRQHRRRLRVAAAAIAAMTLAALGHLLGGDPGPAPVRQPEAAGLIVLSPGAVLARLPYLGVACPTPNSVRCDRIRLEVQLRRPAVSVRATLAGRTFALDHRGDRPARGHAPRTQFDGFLQPAGIVRRLGVKSGSGRFWYGDRSPPPPRVQLRIDYGHGQPVMTKLRVPLATGWG
jgi:hypothetical protein